MGIAENSAVFLDMVSNEGGNQSSPPASIEEKITEAFGEEASIALAVAKAESRLNPNAVNINKSGSRDIGIFQLNDCHGWSEEQRFDEDTNIRLAKQLKDKSGWKNWSVFKSGEYLKFIN